MKKILITILMSLVLTSLFAQKTDSVSRGFRLKENRVYPIRVNHSDENFLTAINDSSLQIFSDKIKYGTAKGKILSYKQVNDLSIKHTTIGRSILIGAITGVIAGGIVGAALSYSKPAPGAWVVLDFGVGGSIAVGSILGGLSGIVVGAVVGSAKKKFKISGSKERFQSMYRSLTD